MSKNDKLIKWLKERPLIKVNRLFINAGMDTGNASRSWSSKKIPEKFIKGIEKQLIVYGYK